MGIRPSFYLVIGLDNVKDNDKRLRLDNTHLFEQEIDYFAKVNDKLWFERQGEPFATYDSILYNMNGSQTDKSLNNNITGLIIEEHFDSWILRSLLNKSFGYNNKGFFRFKLVEKKHILRYDEYDMDDVLCHRHIKHRPITTHMLKTHWERAEYYMNKVGWAVTQRNLRLLCVWDWR